MKLMVQYESIKNMHSFELRNHLEGLVPTLSWGLLPG